MSSIRVRSYLDESAPQFDGQDKRAFIKFLKAMFEAPSYSNKVFNGLTVNLTNKTIETPVSTSAGFSVGNLIKITGTTSPAFQSDFYRVIDNSGNKLVLAIANSSTVTYPATDTAANIRLEHAPLDWEICYSTDTQFSLRSKDPTSSKNVFTITESKNPKLTVASTSINAMPIKISKDINKTTGAVIDDYTAVTNSIGLNSEALHFLWSYGVYYTSQAPSGNVPWFIFSSSKFVYLIIGASSTRNFSRVSSTNTYRETFYFGDPDFLGDPSYIDTTGYVFKSCYSVNTDANGGTGHVGGFTRNINSNPMTSSSRSNDASGYVLRPYEGSGSDIEPVFLSSITCLNNYSGGGSVSYPNGPTRGFLFFPIYTMSYKGTTNNTGNAYRATLPFTLYSPNSLNNYVNGNFTVADYTLIKLYNGKLIMPVITQASSGNVSCAAFFELD